MASRGDVYAAWVAENAAREEARANMLPPPESTIANDLSLYGQVVTASEYETSKKQAEADFDAKVKAKEAELAAKVQAAQGELALREAAVQKDQQTLADREAELRTSAASADVAQIEKDKARVDEEAAAAQKVKRNVVAGALVVIGLAWALLA